MTPFVLLETILNCMNEWDSAYWWSYFLCPVKTLSPSPAAAALMSFFCTSRRRERAEEDDHHRGDPVLQINGKGLPERCNVHHHHCVVGKTGGSWMFRRKLWIVLSWPWRKWFNGDLDSEMKPMCWQTEVVSLLCWPNELQRVFSKE